MFRINTRVPRKVTDPLRTRRSAADWFRELPPLDVIARQERVLLAFAELRNTRATFDIDRVAAILYLDSAIAVDHRRVLKWYLDDEREPTQLADHFWDLARDITSGFVFAYDAAYRQALGQLGDRHWRSAFPRIVARLIHHYGFDAKLHLFRGERPIPARWSELHRLFLRACELKCERDAAPVSGEDPVANYGVEQEYLHVLLIDQLNTGNLTPAELDWASNKLRTWSRQLRLASTPPAVAGFFVDLAGSAGLVRRSERVQGAKIGYLDTTPLVNEIERARAALREPGADGKPADDWKTRWQGAILDKIRPAISPSRDADLRRHPRVETNIKADVRIGLARITRDLLLAEYGEHAARGEVAPDPAENWLRRPMPDIRVVTPPARAATTALSSPSQAATTTPKPRPRPAPKIDPSTWAAEDTEEIDIYAVPDDPTTIQPLAPQGSTTTPPPRVTEWRLRDRSATGWKLVASEDLAERLALGALVAVRPADASEWMLGVVSRINKRRNREVEAGMTMLGGRIVPVALHGRRAMQADMAFEVDGVEAAVLGARFEGLYLMPSSRDTTGTVPRTLVIPKTEHFEGRRVILATSRSNYTMTLGHVIDQRADWAWVTIKVDAKAARAA
jgi:hypothetical protein